MAWDTTEALLGPGVVTPRLFMLRDIFLVPTDHPQRPCSVFLTMVGNDEIDTADQIESFFAFEPGEICRGVLVNVERVD